MKKYFLEFKNRSLLTFFFIIFNFFIFYFYKEFLLFSIVKITLNNSKNNYLGFDFNYYLIFTDVTEIFYVYFNIIFFYNFQFLFYFIILHLGFFFSPALFKKENFFFFNFIKLSFSWFVISFFFSYFYVIPATWNFFLGFQGHLTNQYLNNFSDKKK